MDKIYKTMMCQTIWYFVLLCVVVKSDDIGKFHVQNQKNFLFTENEDLVNFPSTDKSSEERTKEMKIIKRGIVLVDEDFDVPSAIYAHENNSGPGINLNTAIFERNEGSGIDELNEKELANTTKQTTFTRSSSAKGMFNEKEFSNTAKQTIFTHSPSAKASTSTQPTKEVKLTESPDDHNKPSSDLDSSGDEILITTEEYEVKEITTFHITLVHKEIPDICMNSTCGQDNIFVSLSEDKNLMAEGTNITLLCKNNNSDHNMLYWYKSNGTEYFLQTFGTNRELLFNIPDAKSFHSGMYKCVKWTNPETCCNKKLSISVYKIPWYKYHLIILGLTVGAGLLLCIFLSVRQTITLKSYTKQFVEKHGKDNLQLL